MTRIRIQQLTAIIPLILYVLISRIIEIEYEAKAILLTAIIVNMAVNLYFINKVSKRKLGYLIGSVFVSIIILGYQLA